MFVLYKLNGLTIRNANKKHPLLQYTTFMVINIANESWYFKNKKSYDVDDKGIEDIHNKIELVLLVANKREFKTVMRMLEPYKNNKIYKLSAGEQTYYIGKFGVLYTALVQLTAMGSGSSGGSAVTVIDIVGKFEPYIIISVGVAWGRGDNDQEMGDVIVARQIIPLQANQRLGPTDIIDRDAKPQCTTILINRLQNCAEEWIKHTQVKPKREWVLFKHRKELDFDVHIGDIVSGNFVLDNAEKKKEILNKYPTAIGGEMESWGLYVGATRWQPKNTYINWAAVKGICDFGENKSDEFQYLAVATAVDFVHYVCNNEHRLRDMLGNRHHSIAAPVKQCNYMIMMMILLPSILVVYFFMWEGKPIMPEKQKVSWDGGIQMCYGNTSGLGCHIYDDDMNICKTCSSYFDTEFSKNAPYKCKQRCSTNSMCPMENDMCTGLDGCPFQWTSNGDVNCGSELTCKVCGRTTVEDICNSCKGKLQCENGNVIGYNHPVQNRCKHRCRCSQNENEL